jgi:L-cysteine desulfidase
MTGGKHGIPTAVAAGIISGRADLKLEVLSALSDGSGEKIEEYLRNNTVKIEELNTPCTFELHLDGRLKSHRATVRITATHTNVTEVTLDGIALASPTDYTYDATTGLFATVPGRITVPAATYTQDPVSGEWVINPASVTLRVVGTV